MLLTKAWKSTDKKQEIDLQRACSFSSNFPSFSELSLQETENTETKGTKYVPAYPDWTEILHQPTPRELLTFTQANSICESGLGIGGSSFQVVPSSSI